MRMKQLRYFIEVYQQMSFSRASGELGISQPALSKVIAQLEDELHVQLFDRSSRQLRVTHEGETMYTYAQKVMREAEDMKRAAEDIRLHRKGRFTFGLPPVIGSSFFPHIISTFKDAYPDADLRIVEEGAKDMERSLLEGSIDVGVGILPINEAAFDVVPLVERKLLLVVSESHPLAEREHVPLTALRDENFLLFMRGFSLYDRVREACIDAGFEPKIVNESTQWDFLLKLARENMGITFLPETVLADAATSGIKTIDVHHPSIHWNLALIRRKNSYQSPAAEEWIRWVRAYFGD
ncbi:LysR substrate-binding domain-containing protein [Geomicrobium sp. JSM 1781026]|uniref:LysR substrate-binding domain-containing protein n=1 Tax=Geomicrobium sp. JSM 1781026 TaxID=3344580 RepID=UPI0035C03F24